MTPNGVKQELSTTQLIKIVVFTGLLAGLIAGGITWGAFSPGKTPKLPITIFEADPDERPPIIINNGSVDFEADRGHDNYPKPKWEEQAGSLSKIFKHVQADGAPLTGFLAETIPARKATCKLLNGTPTTLKPPFFGNRVVIGYYSEAGTSASIKFATMTMDNGTLLLSLTDPATLDTGDKNAKIKDAAPGDANKLKIRTLEVGNFQCTIDDQGNTRVKVHQLK